MYVFGGCTQSSCNAAFNDLWRLDLNSKEWIRPLASGMSMLQVLKASSKEKSLLFLLSVTRLKSNYTLICAVLLHRATPRPLTSSLWYIHMNEFEFEYEV